MAALDYERLFRNTPNCCAIIGADGAVAAASPAMLRLDARLFDGPVSAEQRRLAWAQVLGSDAAALVDNSLQAVMRSGEMQRLPTLQTRGSPERVLSVVHAPVAGVDGRTEFVLECVTDVSDFYAALRARMAGEAQEREIPDVARENRFLRDQVEYMRRLFEHAPGAVSIYRGPTHVFELVNRTYLQIVQHRDVIGKTVREAFPELEGQGYFELLDRVYQTAEPFIGRGMPVKLQYTPGAEPEERWVDFVLQPVLGAHGEVVGLFSMTQDITEQRRAQLEMNLYRERLEDLLRARTAALAQSEAEHAKTQAQLHHVQRLEAIGRLTGGVAHDFNNLLQVLSNSLQLVQRSVGQDAQARRWIATAQNAVSSGSKLTGQLLAFARRQPLEPQVVNIGKLVQGMDDLLRRSLGGGVALEIVPAAGLWNTFADPAQLENVILNLTINARDAVDEDGKITIEMSNTSLDEHYAASHAEVTPGQYILLAVSDTGCGMPAEVMERAFEPFFSTKPEGRGTGLGLSMVYGFVKQSGGHVKIYSEVGQGTSVKIYLPRAMQEEQRRDVEVTGPVAGGSETVLVVEDDPALLATTVAMLTDLGYRVLKAPDASSALIIVQSGIPIDLLFTDVVMPGPVKSVDLAREAQAMLPDLQVLFTSGYTRNAIVHGGRLDPGVNLISKPYRREELAKRLRQLLARSHRQRIEHIADLPRTGQATVLFVEDDCDLRQMGEELLRTLGYGVVTAPSGELALDLLLGGEPVDVVLTDVALPGMSGVELARMVRTQLPRVPVILASGYGRSAIPGGRDIDRDLMLLPKPYSLEGLERALRITLAGSARAAAGVE